MALPEALAGKNIGVLGAGTEGAATVRWLLANGASVTVADRDSKEKLGKTYDELSKLGVTDWRLGDDYLNGLEDFDVVFRTPFLPTNDPALEAARKAGVTVTSHVKLFLELCSSPVIGISGTKGKGTTAGLVHAMLQAGGKQSFLGGNIGIPPLGFLADITQGSIVVLELSSFQLEDLDRSPHVAVITNLTEDHLDRHTTVEEYHAAKRNLLAHQLADDVAILNADDAGATKLAESAGGHVQWFSTKKPVSPGVFVDGTVISMEHEGEIEEVCSIGDIQVPGEHNRANVLAACLAAAVFDVGPSAMKQAIGEYRGLPYHLEFVGEKNGIRFFNDSYASSPTATIPAIESFEGPIVLISGGLDRGLGFDGLVARILDSDVRNVLLLGTAGKRLGELVAATAKRRGVAGPTMHTVQQKEDLATQLKTIAQSGDVVLFSPAAPSFDWFKNFTERGAFFTELVTAW